ncbi:protein disulfide oxidoreductase [Sulfurimonas sp.]|jgi:thiol-disulfide isomerase/thioredoxin|uniref:protein disulfide oxidoreductase n=1 Tax=Sulfurimonas sp. TaxID=2022749 RepID=UPI0025E1AEBC|nr:protein disulfide oxidoreductase [Sulfurimonas sp.]MCK9472592.1 protein disulfide oxidoreductase [Sulfurimonas sp.]MDD3504927.1 protein disulfide oxidoreductase [Sulfurimonas sp.]
MKHKFVKYFKEILFFILVMTIFANLLSFYRSSEVNKEPLYLSSVTLLNNTPYKLPENEPVLIYFWATWCPVCKAQAQNIQTISENYNVLTIALKSGSDAEISEYLRSRNLDFKVINDFNAQITQKYSVFVFPTTIIYDKNGDEFFSDVGYTSTFGLRLRMWWATL